MHLTTWWSTWRGYRQNLSTYYLRSPFRSHFFVAPTLLLVTDFFLMGAILVKNWSRLPTWTINLLGLVFFGLILAWRMAFRTHQAMQRFLEHYILQFLFYLWSSRSLSGGAERGLHSLPLEGLIRWTGGPDDKF